MKFYYSLERGPGVTACGGYRLATAVVHQFSVGSAFFFFFFCLLSRRTLFPSFFHSCHNTSDLSSDPLEEVSVRS